MPQKSLRGPRATTLALILWCACGREQTLFLGLDFPGLALPDAASVVVGIDLDEQLQVFALDPSGDVAIRRESPTAVTGRAYAFRYDEPLESLGLKAGALEATDSTLGRLPTPRGASEAELPETSWSDIEPSDSPLHRFHAKALLPNDTCPSFVIESFFRLGTTAQVEDATYVGNGVVWLAVGGERSSAKLIAISRTSSRAMPLPTPEGVIKSMARAPSGEIWLSTAAPPALWRGGTNQPFARVVDWPGECAPNRMTANDRELYGIGKCGTLHQYELADGHVAEKKLSNGGGPEHVRGAILESAEGEYLIADPSGDGTVFAGHGLDFASEKTGGPAGSILTTLANTPAGMVAIADLSSEAQFLVRAEGRWGALGPQLSIASARAMVPFGGGFVVTGLFGYLRVYNGFRFCESQPGILSSSSASMVVKMDADTVLVVGNRFGSSDFPDHTVVSIASVE
ncbi:MAG: hypothetical protein HY791_00035 [Deltaproteobacteria bacterium]|nr:hypothetical protein [Deltaproteobacteria bacterium]